MQRKPAIKMNTCSENHSFYGISRTLSGRRYVT
jgi:hypothetical protein